MYLSSLPNLLEHYFARFFFQYGARLPGWGGEIYQTHLKFSVARSFVVCSASNLQWLNPQVQSGNRHMKRAAYRPHTNWTTQNPNALAAPLRRDLTRHFPEKCLHEPPGNRNAHFFNAQGWWYSYAMINVIMNLMINVMKSIEMRCHHWLLEDIVTNPFTVGMLASAIQGWWQITVGPRDKSYLFIILLSRHQKTVWKTLC